MLKAKLRGEEIRVRSSSEAPVIDLMEALKASVAAAKKRPDAEKPASAKSKSRRKARAS